MDKAAVELKQVELPFGKIIYQSKQGQGISSETAELVRIILKNEHTENLKVLELGSGSGVISLMLKHFRPGWDITGIDIQSHLVKISQGNCKLAEVLVDFREADLRYFFEKAKYDLVITNPPYFRIKETRISPNLERAISRHELKCNLKDVLSAFNRNLVSTGKGYCLYPENREEELCEVAEMLNMKLDKIMEISSIKRNKVRMYRIELK